MGDRNVSERLVLFIEGLNPAFFAIVMATGIVSVAMFLHGPKAVAVGLVAFNLVLYLLLLVLNLFRVALKPVLIANDATDARRAFGFFTMVAGSNVLGASSLIVLKWHVVAQVLWITGVLLWVTMTYGVLAAVVLKKDKPEWKSALNGTWLLLVVATQSCAVTGVQLHPDNSPLFLACLLWFLSGCFLYVILITLIFYRLTLFGLERADMTPPYWINMGALSISTLAGAKLLASPQILAGPYAPLHPFVIGLTVALWSFASWWIPLLVVMGLWKHGPSGVPLTYNAQIWSMVFPLGMYSVCSQGVAGLLPVPIIGTISTAFAWIAVITWAVCFTGLARHAKNEVWKESKAV